MAVVGDDPTADETSLAQEIDDLAWDDDLPLTLGDEIEPERLAGVDRDPPDEGLVGDDEETFDYGDGSDRDSAELSRRRSASLGRREAWRNRSATGAIATALAMGLQQVFEPERRRPAAVAEAPSDPYSEDDPITVEYVPDDAEGTKVHVKPWLLQKGDPT